MSACNRRNLELSKRRKAFACSLLATLVTAFPIGCSKSSDEGVSAQTSGYQVAEGSESANKKTESSTASSNTDSGNSNSSAGGASTEGAAPAASANKPDAAPTKASTPPNTPAPTSTAAAPSKPSNPAAAPTIPGGAGLPPVNKSGGVALESPSFASLQIPTSDSPIDLVAFLAKTDQAIRDLSVYGSQGMIAENEFRKQAARVTDMKMQVAEKLIAKTDLTEDQLRAARKAKLQALSQLSGLGDIKANDQLKVFVEEIVATGDPELVHDGKLMQMGYAAESLMNGQSKDPAALVTLAKEVVSKEEYRGAPELMQMRGVSSLLEQLELRSEAADLRKYVADAYSTHKDPNLSGAAWQMMAERHPATQEFIEAVKAAFKGDEKSAELVKAGAERMITELSNEKTLVYLVSQLVNIEFSGQPAIAAEIAGAVRRQLDSAKTETLKSEIERSLKSFDTRQALIGKPLPAEGLVTQDGKPLDWASLKGKVVLVDFWATWCTPCLEELPNVEAAYKKLNAKGFEVVGINLDENAQQLDQFLSQRPLPWTTFRSSDPTKLGFNMPIVAQLGIEAIPFVVLVGKDGNVARMHVRGEKLAAAVEELLAAP